MNKKNIYFNYQKTFTYNAMLNFLLGSRGVGKTFNLKLECIKKFIKKGEEFIYLRRYQTEIDKVKKNNNFIKDLKDEGYFSENSLYIKGDTFYIDDKPAGYFIALSKQLIYKSVPYPKVKYIIFDEFLIQNTTYHYLKDEPTQLLELIESIGRMRDIKVFLLGNSISRVNCYFEYFNITMPYNNDFKLFKNGLILVQYIHNKPYELVKENTNFGKLIKGTKYGDYAISNQFLKDDNNFIRKKGKKTTFFYHLSLNNKIYGVWEDKNGYQYISKDTNPTSSLIVSFSYKDHNEKTLLQKNNSVFLKNLYHHFEMGKLYFENPFIKSEIYNTIIKLKK